MARVDLSVEEGLVVERKALRAECALELWIEDEEYERVRRGDRVRAGRSAVFGGKRLSGEVERNPDSSSDLGDSSMTVSSMGAVCASASA